MDDLRSFPASARRRAGYQLDRVQAGLDPDDWKPMTIIGTGVREVRVVSEDGAFRVIYVARFTDVIYVLHCFQKKTQRTGRADIAVATDRYKRLVEELSR